MEEIQQNYTPMATDPEATLVQPRFDMSEEQTAQPVVPLAPTGAAWQRRRLPLALVLVSALVGGLVSVVAYRLYQRAAQPQAAQRVVTNEPPPTPSPELTAAAPAKEDAAPASADRRGEERGGEADGGGSPDAFDSRAREERGKSKATRN
jgi:hypothetical protein